MLRQAGQSSSRVINPISPLHKMEWAETVFKNNQSGLQITLPKVRQSSSGVINPFRPFYKMEQAETVFLKTTKVDYRKYRVK